MGAPLDEIAQIAAKWTQTAISSDAVFWGTMAVIATGLWLAGVVISGLTAKSLGTPEKYNKQPPRSFGLIAAPTVSAFPITLRIMISLIIASVALGGWLYWGSLDAQAACRPKVEWRPGTKAVIDPQLEEPAALRQMILTRRTHVRYYMKIAARGDGLLNLQPAGSGFTDKNATKKEFETGGIELRLYDPIGAVGLVITPQRMGGIPLSIEFECIADG